MARSPLAASMVGKTIGGRIADNQVPVYVERFGNSKDEIFVTAPELRRRFGARFDELPTDAIGVYTYFKRLSPGLRQMMAGERKFTLDYIKRDDIASLTKEAADISGIPFITDVDKDEVQKILKAK
jgi:glutamate synthase domain-containing protein 2